MSTSSPPDDPAASLRQLATRAQRGEQLAFDQLLRRLDPGLRRVLLRRTGGNTDLTDELVQETWVAVWHALAQGRYDPRKAAISTFIYAVARKLWLQHLRRAGSAPPPSRLDALLGDSLEGWDNPATMLQAGELLEAMRACLHAEGTPFSLSAQERWIVIGIATGESERTLARQLGVAASTIHAHKQLAYKNLRRCLKAKGFPLETAERSRAEGKEY